MQIEDCFRTHFETSLHLPISLLFWEWALIGGLLLLWLNSIVIGESSSESKALIKLILYSPSAKQSLDLEFLIRSNALKLEESPIELHWFKFEFFFCSKSFTKTWLAFGILAFSTSKYSSSTSQLCSTTIIWEFKFCLFMRTIY